MHLICLGVFKSILKFFYKSKYHKEAFYLTKKEQRWIDQVWMNVKLPSVLQRQPRSIMQHLHHFKANEIRNFMCYVAKPIFAVVFKNDRIKYRQLVDDIVDITTMLNRPSIPLTELDAIERRIVQFLVNYKDCFGETELSINVHSLLHLVLVVRNWGPLWCYSLWPFEKENGMLLRFLHGCNNKGISACRMYSIAQNLPHKLEQVQDPLLQHQLSKLKTSFDKQLHFVQVAPHVYIEFAEGDATRGVRMIKNNRIITSKCHKSSRTHNDYLVSFIDPTTKQESFGVVHYYNLNQSNNTWHAQITRINGTTYSNEMVNVPVVDIVDVCVAVEMGEEVFVSKLVGNPQVLEL